jgi:hypothetical protein
MIKEDGLKPTGVVQPLAAIRLGYRLNYAPQDDLFEALAPDLADLYKREWSVSAAETPGLTGIYPAAEVLPDDITPSALALKADADAEAARRLAMYAAPIHEFEIEMFADPVLMPGQAVTVQYHRFGFESGRLALVTGFEWSPVAKRATLRVWVWM